MKGRSSTKSTSTAGEVFRTSGSFNQPIMTKKTKKPMRVMPLSTSRLFSAATWEPVEQSKEKNKSRSRKKN